MSNVPSNDAVNQPSSSNQKDRKAGVRGMGWLLPLLLLVLAGGLTLYFIRGSAPSPLPVARQFVEAADTSSHKKVIPRFDSTRHPMEIELPNDSVVVGSNDGLELHLAEYLNNRKDTINKNRWFNFDSLSFENDNVTLSNSSMHQIQNVVYILKAYPKMKMKIGAFTDKTNDEAADLNLTRRQANEVAAALKKAGGSSAQIVAAEGYGSKYAKAPVNAPIADRMKDRKISINITEK